MVEDFREIIALIKDLIESQKRTDKQIKNLGKEKIYYLLEKRKMVRWLCLQ